MSHTVAAQTLERMRYQADPPADGAIAQLLGPAPRGGAEDDPSARTRRIGEISRVLAQWHDNRSLQHWPAAGDAVSPALVAPLQTYLQACCVLPDWADPALIARAEALFVDDGVLSCTLLFCASLPECYLPPDLAAVLHAAGQLEQHTEYRIRSTAAMIFPVMLRGGLTSADGCGVAQVLKVRLIHATIRHLVLRGSPEQVLAARAAGSAAGLPALGGPAAAPDLYQALYRHGWDVERQGLPNDQEELAYTLLTFGYVFLRSLRRLGVGLPPHDERAYLHAWNVVGHLLGIRRELMADDMVQAAALFVQMQQRARARRADPDPRPALARALMLTMERNIPLPLFKPFPVLLTRALCGPRTVRDLGLAGRVAWPGRLAFAASLGLVRAIDALLRRFVPGFSIARMLTRVVGYHTVTRLLLDQTRPLRLPPRLIGAIADTVGGWSEDRRAPAWLNALEDRWTTRGRWQAPPAG